VNVIPDKSKVDGTDCWRDGRDEDNDSNVHEPFFYQGKSLSVGFCPFPESFVYSTSGSGFYKGPVNKSNMV